MTIYSLYIFDRHCACVYYQDWHRTKRPKPSNEGGILKAVSKSVAPASQVPSVVIASSDASQLNSPLLATPPTAPTLSSTGLAFDEEAKLVYGVVLSLRNMIKKISGRDEQFTHYRTSSYKFHLYETLTGYKFVMLSDPNCESLRFILRSLYVGPFIEFVVRNPLVPMDSKEQGIDNDYFRVSVDRTVRGLSAFA
ncbi:Sybindin-like protein [Flagelloscypha sp. PMI_526]|nr:Sybindin-like protein [Flagelloscypha sp. PMI_526]